MKILLLESGVLAPEKFVYQCYPPHGLLYLAAYLREKRPHHELKVLDLMARRSRPTAVDEAVKSFAPDLVAIHAMSFQAPCLHALAGRIKSLRRGCLVAAGGPHPSAAPESVLADPNIDVAGIGEGEQTFLELVDRWETGADPAGIPGTVVRAPDAVTPSGGTPPLIYGPPRDFLSDLDALPFPAWDLINLRDYFTDVMLNQNDITFRREVCTIFTSRACPFNCIFCHNMFGKKFRGRSPESVLAEMEFLHRRYGIREFHVIDDCFNFDPARAQAVMEGILSRGLDLKLAFPNGLRGDRLTDPLLQAMKAAGVYKINFGIESGSPRVQKLIKKGLSLEAIRDGIARTARKKIFTHGFFMLGFPGETEEEARATINFACASDLHTAGFALLSPFPGTEVADMALTAGKNLEFDPEDTSYMRLTANLTAMDDRTLLRLHRLAHWKFYGHPRRLYRILTTMPRPTDFFRVGLKHFRLKFL